MAIDDPESAQAYGRDLLLGDLVRLRPLDDRDLIHLERWWGDPEWQVLQQDTVRPQPDGPAQDRFRRWSANDSGTAAGFSIETTATGEFVGHVSLWGATLPARGASLSVVIGPNHVEHGYGTDAVRVALRYAFRAMGLHRVQLEAFAFNARGIRAYEKAGFVVEGVRRQALFLDGRFADVVVMGALLPDWEAAEAREGDEAST